MTIPLAMSLILHLALYATYNEVKGLRWKGQEELLRSLFPSSKYKFTFNPAAYLSEKLKFLQPEKKLEARKSVENQDRLKAESPLLFISVAPFQESPEPPKEAKFYSDRNSIAANPKMDRETGEPKIDGRQDKVIQTLDIPKPSKPAPKPQPPPKPQPKPEQEKQPEKKTEELKPTPQPLQPLPQEKPVEQLVASKKVNENKIEQKPGDTRQGKPVEESSSVNFPPTTKSIAEEKTAESAQSSTRPLTLAEARARQQGGLIAGEKYKQEGGVRRVSMEPSVDAKATPFGAYDSAVFYAIQQRWYDLLEKARYAGDRRGKVVIDFRLHYDGKISNLQIVESTVGELLTTICRMAIEDPAPFERWPADMRRMIGADYREVRITFYYL